LNAMFFLFGHCEFESIARGAVNVAAR
jgi:hypothetical protein